MDMRGSDVVRRWQGVVTVSDRTAEASGTDQPKNCFTFTVPVSGSKQLVKRFRDPIALDVLRDLAERLGAEGFTVTEAKPGKACDGGFSIRFEKFDVEVVIAAQRRADVADCWILTWCIKHIWKRASERLVSERLEAACTSIGRALAENPKVASLHRMTQDEADSHWQKLESTPFSGATC
jgi:hypothetical protein